jgi:hypothetical protein
MLSQISFVLGVLLVAFGSHLGFVLIAFSEYLSH